MSKSCFHCALPLPDKPIIHAIQQQSQLFCCHGCAQVCESIYASGMEGFYQRTLEGTLLAPPPPLPDQLAHYDIEEIQADYTDITHDLRELDLLIEGIHCAACVWLIENRLNQIRGVQNARVNLTGRRLKLSWFHSQIALSQILHTLAEIGYIGTPYSEDSATLSLKKQNRALLYRMAVAGFGMMNLLWISIALYSGADQGGYRTLFHWVGLLLATPVLLYSGAPFFKGAWQGIKNRHPNMDLPIAIGAFISWAYSVWITVSQSAGHVYFDTVVNFLFVILVGRYLEAIFKNKAVSTTQRLLYLQPKTALLVLPNEDKRVPIKSIQSGDLIRIKPGEAVAVDGIIKEGVSYLDEAMLTGESKAVKKQKGMVVFAGTINEKGSLLVEVQKTLTQSMLGQMIALVEQAQASKAPIQCTADKIVPWFVGITLSLALLTFIYWLPIDFEKALMAATSVLIITCPCAFGLATPLSIAVASGIGAKHGILIKNGAVLETLSHIPHFIFDKTGTLTTGKAQITQIRGDFTWKGDKMSPETKRFLQKISAIEAHSEHPIAKAILALNPDVKSIKVSDFQSQAGQGVSARINGQLICIGQAQWFAQQQIHHLEQHDAIVSEYEAQAMSPVHIAIDDQEVAILAFQDPLRAEAAELIQYLQQQQIQITLLSGDKQSIVEKIAQQLGQNIKVIGEVLPQDKMQVVIELQKNQGVAMVGDGINDAPALVQADVGIALESGTDVSIASADIVLMHQGLMPVAKAHKLAKTTLTTIRQNMIISLAYNVIMIPLAIMAIITPLIAAIAMPISSLLVIANAARINRFLK